MWKRSIGAWVGAGLLGAALPLAIGPLAAMAQSDEPQATPRVTPTTPAARALRIVTKRLVGGDDDLRAVVEEAPTGEYWIGIGLGELSDIVKQQLGLEHGLVVDDVMAEGPAAKADFKQHDILVKVGDQVLKEPTELVKAVEEAKETELSISLLRGGKELTLKVTPVKRPQPEFKVQSIQLPHAAPPAELREEIKKLEEALQGLKSKTGGEGLGIFFARPGVVAATDVLVKRGEFPKDLSIQVTKEGSEPAKIHVKKGDKEWDVTEDKLGELPDDVRPHVHHFFGGLWGPGLKEMAARMTVGGLKGAPLHPQPLPPTAVPVPAPKYVPVPSSSVPPPTEVPRTGTGRAFSYRVETRGADDKFDEILKELKQLRKEVDELRSKPAAEEKK